MKLLMLACCQIRLVTSMVVLRGTAGVRPRRRTGRIHESGRFPAVAEDHCERPGAEPREAPWGAIAPAHHAACDRHSGRCRFLRALRAPPCGSRYANRRVSVTDSIRRFPRFLAS